MKTIIALLTTTVLVAGASSAIAADLQGSDEAANNQLSWSLSRGGDFGGAYASAVPAPIRGGTWSAPIKHYDFQADGDH